MSGSENNHYRTSNVSVSWILKELFLQFNRPMSFLRLCDAQQGKKIVFKKSKLDFFFVVHSNFGQNSAVLETQ